LTCSSCGTNNEPHRKFCRECGERLSSVCVACGAPNAADDKFCGECGAPLSTETSDSTGVLPQQQRPEGGAEGTERRLVSVLFADLVGSTPFAEGRDPEDVRSMLTAYFERAASAIEHHGGVVEKFIGDAVMALWGAPTAHEDDAERAVRAALDIVDRVDALGAELGVTLQARVGVLSGEAVATVGAVGQGLVAGDLVNTAARLQGAADPGTVLVGEGTYRAASRGVVFTPVEPLTLKGKQDKVPAWRALRVVSELGGSGRGLAPEPPFVSRDEELRLAKELLHATGREGRPRLLSVTGVAGVGKSRLLWELRKYADGLSEDTYWHQGRCPAYGEGVSFWAFAEMVRGRAGIAETDDEATQRAALTSCLTDLVADDERRWMEPRLGHLLGLDPAPPGGSEELFGAWRRFVERVAERGTTVLVFEDLHWADPGLLDFVESLLAWSRHSPVLVVSAARPELSERRPAWGATARASFSLHLDPLPAANIRALVTGYVEGLPEDAVERLVERAEGIPLYAVETVRMLADRGYLEEDGPIYRVVSDLAFTLEVPETLHALVAARLDALPESERSLVLDAAVTGHSFTLEAVCAVAGRPADEVEPQLRALVAKQVFDQEVDPRSAERGQLHFVQSVIQEVAYSTLSKAARRAKHLACARWFAGLEDAELAGVAAVHYLEAFRAEPGAADAEELAGHALHWLRLAADRALSLGSPETALEQAVLGLTFATTPQDRAALHATAARAARYSGRVEIAWEHIAAASDAYRLLDDADSEGQMLSAAAPAFEGAARADVLRRMEELDGRLYGPGPTKVLVLAALSKAASMDGRPETALRWSEEALVSAQSIDDDEALIEAAGARAYALFNAERHFEAALLSEGRMELARRSGSAQALLGAAVESGVLLATSEPRRALEAFLEAVDCAARAGIAPAQSMALANAAESAIDLGELDTAQRCLREAGELGGGDRLDQDGVALSHALLNAYRGDGETIRSALEALDELEARRRGTWDAVQMTTWFLRTRSVVRLLQGDWAPALADASDAITLDHSGANSSNALWQGVHAASRLHDAAGITALLDATSGLRGEWVGLVRDTAQAVLLTLAGDAARGADAMTAVLAKWRDRDFPLDHAFATAIAVHVLPDEFVARAEVEAARTYLGGIGADGIVLLLG
jgi:class 3 adenylate cyclase/tetratricopeptide (TPR) repeat protein